MVSCWNCEFILVFVRNFVLAFLQTGGVKRKLLRFSVSASVAEFLLILLAEIGCFDSDWKQIDKAKNKLTRNIISVNKKCSFILKILQKRSTQSQKYFFLLSFREGNFIDVRTDKQQCLFVRFNSKRFGANWLCLICQSTFIHISKRKQTNQTGFKHIGDRKKGGRNAINQSIICQQINELSIVQLFDRLACN